MATIIGYAPFMREVIARLGRNRRTHVDSVVYTMLCSMMAYKETVVRIKGGTLTIRQRQLVATSRELAKLLDLDRDTVRRVLDRLERNGDIRIETRAIFRPATHPETTPQLAPETAPVVTIVTLCNFESYDRERTETAPQLTPETAQIPPRFWPKSTPEVKETKNNEQLKTESNTPPAGGVRALRLVPDSRRQLFEKLWSIYPSKTGKTHASKAFARSVKTDEDCAAIETALANYLGHLAINPWKTPQNGSTWFRNWRDEQWASRSGSRPHSVETATLSVDDLREQIREMRDQVARRGQGDPWPLDTIGEAEWPLYYEWVRDGGVRSIDEWRTDARAAGVA